MLASVTALVFPGCVVDASDQGEDDSDTETIASVEEALSFSAIVIKNVNSGQALNIYDNSTGDAAPVIQWPYSGQANSQFRIEDLGDGHHRIVPLSSGKCLDIMAGAPYPGVAVQQWTCLGGDNQRFQFEAAGMGTYRIKAKQSGLCLDVFASGTASGNAILQAPCDTAKASQKFVLQVP
ncbi:RICIN domain-containing protein [Sorangium cellulosum]|uniref:RICIN domain-containing protein n=1 Tax=Sorangium cellulosum TaxID=56 RepID=UPI001331A9CA|nr:RICIN domain-containing protein [Sorangium cellulosum]